MKKFIIPTVLVVILGFFYVYYTQTETQGQTGSLVSQNNSGTNNRATIAVGTEIISLLEKLDRIELDTKLFKQATFQSLKDFSITLRPQGIGRPNPFAPIGTEGGSNSSSVTPPQSPSSSVAPVNNTQSPQGSSSAAQSANQNTSNPSDSPEDITGEFIDVIPLEE